MASQQPDVLIIGAGPGGYVAGIRAGQLGMNVVVVEKDPQLGGTCLHRGCIPTKALLHTADVLQQAREAAKIGVTCSDIALDLKAAHAHKRKVVTKSAKGVEFLFRKNKVTWVPGTARLAGGRTVDVTRADGSSERFEPKHVILASGSRCGDLPHIQADGDRIINSDHALDLQEVPSSLIVLGAGAVGMEFASMLSRFGAKVTVIELLDRVLPLEDPAVSAEVEKAFRRQGIAIHTATRVEEVTTDGEGVRCRAVDGKGEETWIEAERMLLAVGRPAVLDSLGLDDTGVKVEKGRVVVDQYCRTGEAGIYAIGDLIATPWLAHVASAEGILAVEHIAGKSPRPLDYHRVPGCTYCSPEVASIGYTEPQAREAGYEVRIGSFPFTASSKAAVLNEQVGFVKIVADARYDEILGVHVVGPQATELIAEASAALAGELTAEELALTIHAHPTLHEAVHEAAEAVHGMAIHF